MSTTSNSSVLDKMPEEISLHILSFLDSKSLQAIACTNLQFKRLAEDHQLWRPKTLDEFGTIVALGAKQFDKSWKQTYENLASSRSMRTQNTKNILQSHAKKVTTDDVQYRTAMAASALFGFAAPELSTHYYPTGQTGSLGSRKITVYKSSQQ